MVWIPNSTAAHQVWSHKVFAAFDLGCFVSTTMDMDREVWATVDWGLILSQLACHQNMGCSTNWDYIFYIRPPNTRPIPFLQILQYSSTVMNHLLFPCKADFDIILCLWLILYCNYRWRVLQMNILCADARNQELFLAMSRRELISLKCCQSKWKRNPYQKYSSPSC